MKRIDPKSLEEWDSDMELVQQYIDDLPEIPEIVFTENAAFQDLRSLQRQIEIFGRVDKMYSRAAAAVKVLRSTMMHWRDLEVAKKRDATLIRLDQFQKEKDRDAWIRVRTEEYHSRYRASNLTLDLIQSRKRLLKRQQENLQEVINIEKRLLV